jgi:hypothetical protein
MENKIVRLPKWGEIQIGREGYGLREVGERDQGGSRAFNTKISNLVPISLYDKIIFSSTHQMKQTAYNNGQKRNTNDNEFLSLNFIHIIMAI